MILFFGQGRLGNQLFQYAFIRSLAEQRERIVSCNFRELVELFGPLHGLTDVRNRLLRRVLTRLGGPLLALLAKTGLITSYRVDTYVKNGYTVPDITWRKKQGLFPLTYVHPCFAQSESFFRKEIVDQMKIKQLFEDKADAWLASLPAGCNKVFVHVRRGDYARFAVLGKPDVTLPEAYYRDAIRWFEKHIVNPFYVFLTDDPGYVAATFGDIANKAISDNPMFVDFAIMTRCEYGIISNSSFSWWGGYMMKGRKKVFAPGYWLGWKSKVEYHKGIAPGFAESIEVKT